jgi:hypothetical protein
MSLGCAAFLGKPCTPDQLLMAVKDVLAARYGAAAKRAQSKTKREEALRLLQKLRKAVEFGPECESLSHALARLRDLSRPENGMLTEA